MFESYSESPLESALQSTDIPDALWEPIGSDYRLGAINRRGFIEHLIGMAGSCALLNHFLERRDVALAMALPSPPETERAQADSTPVKFPGDGATLAAYLSKPKETGPAAGIILIHENRGLDEHIRDVARWLAGSGFVALAPDLLSRQGGTASFATSGEAAAGVESVRDETAIRDLDAAYDYLSRHAAVKKGVIGVMGFGWGGQQSFLYATANPELQAAVVFYGAPPPGDRLALIQCPVLASYGEADPRITSTVPATMEKMNQLGKSYDAKVYPGAPHAFFNDTNPADYNEGAATDAWARAVAFLRKHLA